MIKYTIVNTRNKMSEIGRVLSLYISEKDSKYPINKNEIIVDKKGILNDKHYNTNIERSILITSSESYIIAKDHNIEIPYSTLGENLLIDYNPYTLPVGTQLYIGDVTLEISQPCTLCSHLSRINDKLPKLLKNDRGIFAKVVMGGRIKENDKIYLQSQ